ncbi:hypothetical protein EMIHUDRAFT_208012 [Emiliania huxleyi CCMP1516]|uniref:Secreted protein n=2 Tax=Emiliania huxleyi TaxID=2903 RepID=A0A0D3JBS5_EMIH1|nr:hypothetical protein EMIHUDRAFT_208012 [Emiliania huxleyi CCMP1516]EOD20960.1 hypothetical protein EMIHUDRAFT_208012 [Emiliania huxleyi CCMP1516]|eukprot:XP_005773389.1 hypothetical protein EMIHUDRAFT_208012 [Emiliania huxleyi CCMP1516]
MRPLPSFLLLCASYGVTAIVYDFSTGKNGLDYCIAEADTTSDMTASTTMAAPTPSESTICFDDPFSDFFLAICRFRTRTSEDTELGHFACSFLSYYVVPTACLAVNMSAALISNAVYCESWCTTSA